MKFLKSDTISALLLASIFTVTFSAVSAAGGQGSGKSSGADTASHKVERQKHRDQYKHQKGVGGTGKGGQPGEAEHAQNQGQVR